MSGIEPVRAATCSWLPSYLMEGLDDPFDIMPHTPNSIEFFLAKKERYWHRCISSTNCGGNNSKEQTNCKHLFSVELWSA